METTTQYRTVRPDFVKTDRASALDRADFSVRCDPLSIYADDAATVVRLDGGPLGETTYVALGGAYHTSESLASWYAGSQYTPTLVATLHREGQSCADAVRANKIHLGTK